MKNEFIKMEPLKVGVGNAVKEEQPPVCVRMSGRELQKGKSPAAALGKTAKNNEPAE